MSEMSIRRVAIVGAGKAGSALAAHLVNLGFSVTLMDVTAASSVAGLEHVRPLLYVPERAGEVRSISLDDGIGDLYDMDWIVEALPDRLDLKRNLYARIAPHIRSDAIVTTCDGSLPVAELTAGAPNGFAARFLVAYFALPMAEHRLVEVRPGLDAALARDFGRFLAARVARQVVHVPDGPGGVVARYGLWCLLLAVHVTEKLRLDVEDVEAITGGYFGGTGGGVFAAIDRVGLEELREVATNLRDRLPNDRGARFFALPSSMVGLMARGWTGDGSGRGYFRHEGRDVLALNLTTMAYRQQQPSGLRGLSQNVDGPTALRLKAALGVRDEVGEFLREFLVPCLRYAEYLQGSLGVSVVEFDRIMEWGFGWERGPFGLLDDLGLGARQYYQGPRHWTPSGAYETTPQDEICPRMEEYPVIDRTDHYAVHDLDDGIQAIALTSSVLTPSVVASLLRLFSGRSIGRFVLTTEASDFPALDLDLLNEAFRKGDASGAETYLASLQELGEALERHVCVAAIKGRCLGPSLGLALSCAGIVALAEAEIGFHEGRLGILPTARALALMRGQHGGVTKRMGEVAVALAEGVVAANAELARQVGYLRPTDVTEHLPERLLTTAKTLVQEVPPFVRPSLPPVEGPLVGIIDRGLADRRQRGGLTDHDVAVGHRIRQVVARTTTYEECLERERLETVELGTKALTQARMRHMVETGRPLRN